MSNRLVKRPFLYLPRALEESFRHLATVSCCYVEDIDHRLDREEGFIDIRTMCALGYLQFADPDTVSWKEAQGWHSCLLPRCPEWNLVINLWAGSTWTQGILCQM